MVSAELLRTMAEEFNRSHDGLPLKVERTGGYGDIFRKVSASIQARTLPAMAVSYESMTTEYVGSGAVAPLDQWLSDSEHGLSEAERDDFFPVMFETNTFAEHGGKMYSFPFAKSVLVLFFNQHLLDAAGIAGPPATWDQFLAHCRQIKARTGKYGYAIAVDCSTVDAMIFSMGGRVIEGRETQYDSAEALRVFELLDTLVREDLAYVISPGTFDDNVALSNDQVAFTLRTSASIPSIAELIGKDARHWGVAPIPQANPAKPATVLFGPNVTLFNTTVEQQRTAWAFVKYFTSAEATVRWSLATGYLPLRRSAADHPAMIAFWREWAYDRVAFDCLDFARPEPNVAGWQEVRAAVEEAETAVLTKMKTAAQAASELKKKADAILARNRRMP